MQTTKRVGGLGAAVGAALLLTIGCGGADDGASGTTTTPKADPAKVRTLVLEKADLPNGYEALNVPKASLEDIAESMSPAAAAKSAKITPAKCRHLSAFPTNVKPADVGSIIAMKGTSTLVETVAVTDVTIAKVRKNASGECASLTIDLTEGAAAGAHAKAAATILDTPKTRADDAVVIRQKTTIELKSMKQTMTTLIGMAHVRGYLVTVQVSDPASQGTPDLAAFTSFFTKAVDRVASKTS